MQKQITVFEIRLKVFLLKDIPLSKMLTAEAYFIDSVLTKGKQEVDEKVENALLKRALGYTYDEVKETYDGDQLTKRQVVTKHVPADVGAMIFWLKNRRPQDWKSDYHKVKHDEKVLELREKELEAKAW